MRKFLAVYTGSAKALENANWQQLSELERQQREQEGIAAWQAWHEDHADAILDLGTPLGLTKRISPLGIENARNNITGYVLVEAESHDAAAALFLNHPHFSLFPGDSVEIMECLPQRG